MNILVTGGAGFIGSAFIRFVLKNVPACEQLINLDLLTYAGNVRNVTEVDKDSRYTFVKGDIRDEKLVESLCRIHNIGLIVNFAAETHVDRSITLPRVFFETNVGGTLNLLESVRRHPEIRYHQVSTDEVYGSLLEGQFEESSPFQPNSPYAASKAAADHLVRSYHRTYGLSTTISHGSNTYGPHQLAEKFVPRMIMASLQDQSLPVYGTGENVRDWLFVDDHAEAIWAIIEKGAPGESYNVGGGMEMRNIDLLHQIIDEVALQKKTTKEGLLRLITYVADRPGHDFRYSLNCKKIDLIGWRPRHGMNHGLKKTIEWYCTHYAQNRMYYSRTPEINAFSS